MEENKCPLCQKGSVFEKDSGLAVHCSYCYFSCNSEYFNFLSAAIALARAEIDFEFCDRPEEIHQHQHFVEWARMEVIKIKMEDK